MVSEVDGARLFYDLQLVSRSSVLALNTYNMLQNLY